MTHDELVALIWGGVPGRGGTWADFGAGTGNFTRALHDLTGADAVIYAVDRDARALSRQQDSIHIMTADFTQSIDELPQLDGLLVANALHFVRQQQRVIAQLAAYLRDDGTFLIVEYDVRFPRSYIPHPLPYTRFVRLAEDVGLQNVRQVGLRKSPTTGMSMYAAVGTAPRR